MRIVLRITRKLVRRYRKWPHWAKDLYGLVTYINFADLVPTVAAIALAPCHFFRRLPLVLKSGSPIYRTPVKFFTNFASLFVAVFFFRHPEMSRIIEPREAVWYMLVLIPLTPVLMAVLALGLWSAYQLPRIIPTSTPFPQPNPYPFQLVLSLRLQDHDFAALDDRQEYRAQRAKVLERAFQLPKLREVQHMISTLSQLISRQGDLAQKPGQA